MVLLNLQELFNSLSTGEQSLQETSLTPIQQLMTQILTYIGHFVDKDMGADSSQGLLEFIQIYYHKKYSASYAKHIKTFVASLIRHSKDDTEIRYFSRLFDENSSLSQMGAVNKAISILRKNFADYNTKGDHNLKKTKMKVKEVVKYLQLIFRQKGKAFPEIFDENSVQNRVRDYIVEIQPAIVVETNGIEFLEMVEREWNFWKAAKDEQEREDMREQEEALHLLGQPPEQVTIRDNFDTPKLVQKNPDSGLKEFHSGSPGSEHYEESPSKPFYVMGDLLGKDDLQLDKGYLDDVKAYQNTKKILNSDKGNGVNKIALEEDKNFTNHHQQKKDLQDGDYSENATFEQIYKSLHDPQLEKASEDEFRQIQQLETRLAESKAAIEEGPRYLEAIKQSKQAVIKALAERTEMLEWMNAQCHHMQTTNSRMFNDDEIYYMQEVSELFRFYELFTPKLSAQVCPNVRSDLKRNITDYFDSSHRSCLGKGKREKEIRQTLRAKQGLEMSPQEEFECEVVRAREVVEKFEETASQRSFNNLRQSSGSKSIRKHNFDSPQGYFNEDGNFEQNEAEGPNELSDQNSPRSCDQYEDRGFDDVGRTSEKNRFEEPKEEIRKPNSKKSNNPRKAVQKNPRIKVVNDKNTKRGVSRSEGGASRSKMTANLEASENESEDDDKIRTKKAPTRRKKIQKKSSKNLPSSPDSGEKMRKPRNLKEARRERKSAQISEEERSLSQRGDSLRAIHRDADAKRSGSSQNRTFKSSYRGSSKKKGQESQNSYKNLVKNLDSMSKGQEMKKMIEDMRERQLQHFNNMNDDDDNDSLKPVEFSPSKKDWDLKKRKFGLSKIQKTPENNYSDTDEDERPRLINSSRRGHRKASVNSTTSDQPSNVAVKGVSCKNVSKLKRAMHDTDDCDSQQGVSNIHLHQRKDYVVNSSNPNKTQDLPAYNLKELDSSRYENKIYSAKKRKMYIAVKDFKLQDRNFFALKQGDVVCSVAKVKEWLFVYKENKPQKFGFCPQSCLNLID